MKKIIFILLASCALAQAQQLTNVIFGNVGDYSLNPQKKITVTSTLLYPNPRTINNFLVRQDPVSTATDTNGYFGFTNQQWGKYSLALSGGQGTVFTYYVGTNSSGSVAAASLITNSAALQVDALVSTVSGGSGESNYNRSIGTGESLVGGKDGSTNLLKSLNVSGGATISSTSSNITVAADAPGAAQAATNGLGSAAFHPSTDFGSAGASQAATNGIGIASGLAAFAGTNQFAPSNSVFAVSNALLSAIQGTNTVIQAQITSTSNGAVAVANTKANTNNPSIWNGTNHGRLYSDAATIDSGNSSTNTYGGKSVIFGKAGSGGDGGGSSVVSGVGNFSWGPGNIVTGQVSYALGAGNISSGANSVALGFQNLSSGSASFANGDINTASGNFSTAFGNLNVASGAWALAIGHQNHASDYAVALMQNSCATNSSSFVVNDNSLGNLSSSTNNELTLHFMNGYRMLGSNGMVVGEKSFGMTNVVMSGWDNEAAFKANGTYSLCRTDLVNQCWFYTNNPVTTNGLFFYYTSDPENSITRWVLQPTNQVGTFGAPYFTISGSPSDPLLSLIDAQSWQDDSETYADDTTLTSAALPYSIIGIRISPTNIVGNGNGMTNLNAGQLSGNPPNGSPILTNNSASIQAGSPGNGTASLLSYGTLSVGLTGGLTVDNAGNLNAASIISRGAITGNASSLTNIPASQLTGTIPLSTLPAGVLTNGETVGTTFLGGLTNSGVFWVTNNTTVGFVVTNPVSATALIYLTNGSAMLTSGSTTNVIIMGSGSIHTVSTFGVGSNPLDNNTGFSSSGLSAAGHVGLRDRFGFAEADRDGTGWFLPENAAGNVVQLVFGGSVAAANNPTFTRNGTRPMLSASTNATPSFAITSDTTNACNLNVAGNVTATNGLISYGTNNYITTNAAPYATNDVAAWAINGLFTNTMGGRSTLHFQAIHTDALGGQPTLVVSNFTKGLAWTNYYPALLNGTIPFTMDVPCWSTNDIGGVYDKNTGTGASSAVGRATWIVQ